MFTGLLTTVVDIRSRGVTVDAYGGQSIAYTTIYSNRPSRINSLSMEQQAILSRSGIVATHKFFCEGDLTVIAENEVVYGGTAYRVTNVISPNDNMNNPHHLTIYCKTPS